MTSGVSLSFVDTATGDSQRVRRPNHLPLSELATANRQRDALYLLSEDLHDANSVDDIFRAAMDAIESALNCERSAILLFDAGGVMQFVAHRGLSDDYRAAVTGHSPWTSTETNATPLTITNVEIAPFPEALKTAVLGEDI